MNLDLDKLEKLCEEATKRPWEVNTDHKFIDIINPENPGIRIAMVSTKKDADYIIEACNTMPALVQRVRELEESNKYLHEIIAEQGKKITEYESNPIIPRMRKAEKLAGECQGLLSVVGADSQSRYDAWTRFKQALAEWEGD